MTLLERVRAVAADRPAQVAMQAGGQRVTYAALSHAVLSFASHLPYEPGETVAVQLPAGIECVMVLLSGLHAGLRMLLLDVSLKEGEVLAACRQAGVKAILLDEGRTAPVGLEGLTVPGWNTFSVSTTHPRPPAGREQEAAFLLLSSGTTGMPKVVLRTAAQTEAALDLFLEEIPFTPDDRVLAVLPFAHSFGLIYVLFGTLSSGATLHVETFSPRTTARSIGELGITVLPATPFMFRILAETPFDPLPDFRGLRLAVSAGSGLPQRVYLAFLEKFGISILQSYGSTETGPVALGRPEHAGSVGRPYPGVVLDFRGATLSHEEAQPFLVRSPGGASGYVGDSDASAAVFRENGIAIGDLGRIDPKGNLVILGRNRPMLMVGGKKVSPAEVEACLLGHPLIEDSVVMGVPAADGGHRIRAVLLASTELDVMEIQAHVARHLASYKVPREIEIVGPEARSRMGKLRYELKGGQA